MNEVKYKDTKYLNLYDLDVELFKRFNLEVEDVIPVRKVFLLITNKGDKVLKKLDYPIKDLEFINNAMEHLKNNDFNRILSFVRTKDGEVYTEWNGDIYCVMNLIEGRECEFSNPIDVNIASMALAQLHLASYGFKSDLKHKNNSYKLIDKFNSRLERLEFFKQMASLFKNKNKFDEIFLENVDYYIEQIKNSILLLEKSQYYSLCYENNKIALCHHDLAHHNILINNEEAYFIDFDYCLLDLKVHDLCNFINKVIKNFAFDVDKAKAIINDYCKINSLDKRELEVLYGMLSFPEDFYSISRDYYAKKKSWDEGTFIKRLIRKASYKEDREEFLESFKKFIYE